MLEWCLCEWQKTFLLQWCSLFDLHPSIFRGLDTLCRFYKGDNFCDILFAFLHTKPFLKRGLHYKERICSLSFLCRSLSGGVEKKKKSLTDLPLLKVYLFPLTLCMLGNSACFFVICGFFFFKFTSSKQEYHQSVKQFRSGQSPGSGKWSGRG